MNIAEYLAELKLLLSVFLGCFIDGFVPVHGSEAILIGISATSPGGPWLVSVVLVASLAHLIAKTIFYMAGQGVIHLPLQRFQKKIDAIRGKFQEHQKKPVPFLFFSVLTGMPPYTAVAILCGIFKYSFPRFLFITFFGLILKYTIVILFPQSIKSLYHFFAQIF